MKKITPKSLSQFFQEKIGFPITREELLSLDLSTLTEKSKLAFSEILGTTTVIFRKCDAIACELTYNALELARITGYRPDAVLAALAKSASVFPDKKAEKQYPSLQGCHWDGEARATWTMEFPPDATSAELLKKSERFHKLFLKHLEKLVIEHGETVVQ